MSKQTNISLRRAITQENHTREVIGDCVPFRRAEVEDDLVLAVQDSVLGQNLRPFRLFLDKHCRTLGWNEDDYARCKHNDAYCWGRVWSIGVYLRRLMPLYEHCANQLIWNGICDYRELPPGTAFLGC